MEKDELLKGEKILKTVKPHPFAFLDLYSISLYLLVVSLFFIFNYSQIVSIIPILDVLFPWITFNIFWWLSLIIPGIIISLFKINWRWFALFVLIGILLTFIQVYFSLDSEFKTMNMILFVIGIFGMILTELYRRSHLYTITSKRIILENEFIGRNTRELFYDKINDLVLKQGFIGKVFDYGSIIPLTGNELGEGQDISLVSAGTDIEPKKGPKIRVNVGGGKTITIPRTKSYYELHNVPDPENIYKLISEQINKYQEAPYLKKILKEIKK